MVLNTVDEVIDSLGGNKAVAKALKIAPHAVIRWRDRKLPAHTFLAIQALLRVKGLYAPPELWGMTAISKNSFVDVSDPPF